MFEIKNCPVGVYMIFDTVCTDYSYNFCYLKLTKCRVAFEGRNSFPVDYCTVLRKCYGRLVCGID